MMVEKNEEEFEEDIIFSQSKKSLKHWRDFEEVFRFPKV